MSGYGKYNLGGVAPDEFDDMMDYDDEYGTSQEQYGMVGANAARIEGSGDYDEEGVSDESEFLN